MTYHFFPRVSRGSLHLCHASTSSMTPRRPSRIIIPSTLPISRIVLLISITLRIHTNLLPTPSPTTHTYTTRLFPTSLSSLTTTTIFLLLLIPKNILPHRCRRPFHRRKRTLKPSLLKPPTLTTSTPSTLHTLDRGINRRIEDLESSFGVCLALRTPRLFGGVGVPRELFEVCEAFAVLVVVGGDVGFVFWVARVGFVAEGAGEGAERGSGGFRLDRIDWVG